MTETLLEPRPRAPGFGALVARVALPPRLYLQSETGVQLPTPGRGRRYWVVARGLCRFYRVPLVADASRARQADAVALEVKRLSPFAETGSHVHFGRDFAAIWLWDQSAARAAAASVGIDLSRTRIVPEPAMQPNAAEGARLTLSLDGVEGQNWADGGLVASRWWRHVPDDRSWVLFQRGASIGPGRLSATPPEPVRPAWLPRPWTTTRPAGRFGIAQLDMRLATAGIAAAIALIFGYQGAEYLHIARNVSTLSSEIESRSNALEPVLAARAHALDNLAAIRRLHELDRYPSQLTLMARIAEKLPGPGSRLTAWLYDRGQLELTIAADQPLDVVKLVRSLESVEHFKGVAAEATGTNNTLRLRVTIEPL